MNGRRDRRCAFFIFDFGSGTLNAAGGPGIDVSLFARVCWGGVGERGIDGVMVASVTLTFLGVIVIVLFRPNLMREFPPRKERDAMDEEQPDDER